MKFWRRNSAGSRPVSPRRHFDQTLDDESRLRTAGAAIGVDRRRRGVDRVDLGVDRRDVVLARQQRGVEIGRHRRGEGRQIGAHVRDRVSPDAGDLAVRVERQFGVGHVVAAVRVGEERLRALGCPFHRPVDLLGRPGADGLLGVDEDLGAEAAADVRSDDAKLVLGRETDEGRKHEAGDMRVLAGRVERDRVRARIVVADRRARLHGVRDQAVVDEIELRHVRRGREGRVGRGLVAEMPVVDGVVRRGVMDCRLAGLRRLGRIDHRGQFRVMHVDHSRRRRAPERRCRR